MTTEGKSALALAIETRRRKAYEFSVQGFFSLGEKPIHKIAVWVNTKFEQDKAVVAAHQVVQQLTAEAESARKDEDLLLDTKTTQILFQACRRAEAGDEEKGYMYSAFPSPEWMRKNLTTDQLAVLINLYNEVRRKEAPIQSSITLEQVESVSKMCAENAASDVPEAVLAIFDREWMTQAFVLLSMKLKRLQHESESESRGVEEIPPPASGEDGDGGIDDGEGLGSGG